MDEFGEIPFKEARILFQMERMLGYVPIGTRDLLACLAHPDMIALTREYLDSKGENAS